MAEPEFLTQEELQARHPLGTEVTVTAAPDEDNGFDVDHIPFNQKVLGQTGTVTGHNYDSGIGATLVAEFNLESGIITQELFPEQITLHQAP